MGIDYDTVLAIGKQFDEKSEVRDFIDPILTEEDLDFIDKAGLTEFLQSNDKFNGDLLNYYNGYGYYVGFDLCVSSPESFRNSFEEGMGKWYKLFPNIPAEVIDVVKIY